MPRKSVNVDLACWLIANTDCSMAEIGRRLARAQGRETPYHPVSVRTAIARDGKKRRAGLPNWKQQSMVSPVARERPAWDPGGGAGQVRNPFPGRPPFLQGQSG